MRLNEICLTQDVGTSNHSQLVYHHISCSSVGLDIWPWSSTRPSRLGLELRSSYVSNASLATRQNDSLQADLSRSWFFSPEFWGGVLSKTPGRSWTEYRLVPLLLVSGLIATFAGPSTAVLATPRVSPWPIGGGSYWLNGKLLWSRYT